MKIYEVLELKQYSLGTVLCKYGDMGDTFFIILDGDVGVKVPTAFEQNFSNYLGVVNFLVQKYFDIHILKDSVSHSVKKFIDLIGIEVFRRFRFKKTQELVKFIDDLIKEVPDFLELHGINITKKIKDHQRFFGDFASAIRLQSKKEIDEEQLFNP